MNYLYFKDHLSFHLCLQIQLADSKPQEGQFLNVSFLPNFFFQILEFQIEIKWIFHLFDVLSTLKYYHLEMKNLDQIIKVVKKWSYDPCLNCTPNADIKDYTKIKYILVKKNYELIIEEFENFEELQVDETLVIQLNPKL